MSEDDTSARHQAELAAAEAAAIGGRAGDDDSEPVDEAARPLAEAGEGQSEGFEQGEAQLVDRASHGDQHAARRAIADAEHEPWRKRGARRAARPTAHARASAPKTTIDRVDAYPTG
jgi:hypothetical protein